MSIAVGDHRASARSAALGQGALPTLGRRLLRFAAAPQREPSAPKLSAPWFARSSPHQSHRP